MQEIPIVCNSCERRISGAACEAFDRIPDRILVWGDPHNSPVPGQQNSKVWKFAIGTENELETWKKFRQGLSG